MALRLGDGSKVLLRDNKGHDRHGGERTGVVNRDQFEAKRRQYVKRIPVEQETVAGVLSSYLPTLKTEVSRRQGQMAVLPGTSRRWMSARIA